MDRQPHRQRGDTFPFHRVPWTGYHNAWIVHLIIHPITPSISPAKLPVFTHFKYSDGTAGRNVDERLCGAKDGISQVFALPQILITILFAAASSDAGVCDALLILCQLRTEFKGGAGCGTALHTPSFAVMDMFFHSSPEPGCRTRDLRRQSGRPPGADSSWRHRAELSFS